jgi:hypothetical protein
MLSRHQPWALAALIALAAATSGCDSSGFAQSISGKRTARSGSEHPTAEKDEASGDARSATGNGQSAGSSETSSGEAADDPVQITGTYLTCGAVAPATRDLSDDHTVYGCNLALESTHEPVKLSRVATSWQWRYDLDAARFPQASVTTRPQDGGAWQVLFDVAGAGAGAELSQLLQALRVVLDLVPRAGSGYASGDHPQLNGTLATLLGRSGGGNGATGGAGAGTPSNAGVTPPSGGIGAAIGGGGLGNGVNPGLSAHDPVVSFRLESLGTEMKDGVRVLAALDDATDVSGLEIEAVDGFEFRGARLSNDGKATVDWRQRFMVRFQKGSRQCAGEGDLHAGAMSIATTCR